MTRDTGADALATLLRQELATLKHLAETIDEEHDALLQTDAERLEAVTKKKDAAIAAHRAQQEARLRWMASRDEERGDTLAALTQRLDRDGQGLAQLQEELADLAEQCQERNRHNGGLIARLQERTRNALGVLRRSDSPDLYSVSGAREVGSDSRFIGKA